MIAEAVTRVIRCAGTHPRSRVSLTRSPPHRSTRPAATAPTPSLSPTLLPRSRSGSEGRTALPAGAAAGGPSGAGTVPNASAATPSGRAIVERAPREAGDHRGGDACAAGHRLLCHHHVRGVRQHQDGLLHRERDQRPVAATERKQQRPRREDERPGHEPASAPRGPRGARRPVPRERSPAGNWRRPSPQRRWCPARESARRPRTAGT